MAARIQFNDIYACHFRPCKGGDWRLQRPNGLARPRSSDEWLNLARWGADRARVDD